MVAPDTQYAYIVEHAHVPTWSGQVGQMNQHCMWSAIVQTVLRDRIPVFFTTDSVNTAALVLYLCKQVHTNGFRKSESASSLPGVAPYKRKRENLNDTASLTRAMLCIVPGMSAAKSNCVLQVYPTARDLIAAPVADLASVVCGTRRLGRQLAAALKKVFS